MTSPPTHLHTHGRERRREGEMVICVQPTYTAFPPAQHILRESAREKHYKGEGGKGRNPHLLGLDT